MIEPLRILLSPITASMETLLSIYAQWLSSAGGAVLCLSLTVAILTLPLQRYGRRLEMRLAEKNLRISKELAKRTVGLTGEARFRTTEKVYQEHDFHPIQNTLSGASFLFQLPFLLAAVVLFFDAPALLVTSFGPVADLSAPDGWLTIAGFRINLLPLATLAVSIYGAFAFYPANRPARRRLIILSVILCILIFNMPAGLVLYWLTQTVFAAGVDRWHRAE